MRLHVPQQGVVLFLDSLVKVLLWLGQRPQVCMSAVPLQGLRIKLLSRDTAQSDGAASPPPQLQQLLAMHDLYLAAGAQSDDSKLLCEGKYTCIAVH